MTPTLTHRLLSLGIATLLTAATVQGLDAMAVPHATPEVARAAAPVQAAAAAGVACRS